MAWRCSFFYSGDNISILNDYDKIAPYYDTLANMIFGKSIKMCQLEFLNLIPPNSKILIVGGGTGWIIKSVLEHTQSSSIIYLEKSKKMIDLAQKLIKKDNHHNIDFVNKSLERYEARNSFDVVICNFFFDLFLHQELNNRIEKVKNLLKIDGLLLVSDFQLINKLGYKIWQKPISKFMHIFFKLTTGISSQELSPIKLEIMNSKFKIIEEKTFFGKMIFSVVFKNH